MPLVYEHSTGQYRDTTTGKFVPRTEILKEIQALSTRAQERMQRQTALLEKGVISVKDWREGMREILKASHSNAATLAGGGKAFLKQNPDFRSKMQGRLGSELRKQYQALDKFADQINRGSLSIAQIRARVNNYGLSPTTAFHRNEQGHKELVAEKRDRVLLAKRTINSGKPCPECFEYSTDGRWELSENVAPPGTDCSCAGRCVCTIAYMEIGRDKLADFI